MGLPEDEEVSKKKRGAPPPPPPKRPPPPPPPPPPAVVQPPPPPTLVRTACYVDFENLFYQCQQKHRHFSVSQAARSLTRLSREIQGEGFARTAVYANWDQLSSHSRFAQSCWAELGWRTVAVPTREDRVSGRMVKNQVDFVMSLDILEEARDHGYEHFFVVSGDADFCEVVERLKRLRRRVTVVSLRPGASYRLREAADQTVLWEMEDVSGDDAYPLKPSRQPPRGPRLAQHSQSEDEFTILKRAYQKARADQGRGQILWEEVRDDYYLPMLGRGDRAEADIFIRQLAEVGYVHLKPHRTVQGATRHLLEIL